MEAFSAGVMPRAPPSDKEQKLMEIILQAGEARIVPLLACIKGWTLESQADLANWRPVLSKLHKLLLGALQQCPRLLLISVELEKTDFSITMQTEREFTELVYEILKFLGFLLENASNKAVYSSTEPIMALLAARNERVVFEATKVVAMLALPPQVHRYAADRTNFVESAVGRNNLLRRRLLMVVQGKGAPKSSSEVLDYLNTRSTAPTQDVKFHFYSSGEDATSQGISVIIPPYEEVIATAPFTLEAACAAATACEDLIDKYKIPERLQFQLFTQIRAHYASRSALTRENLVVERLYALLALFSLFSDAWDVTNYVEQHPELTRGIVELIRVESVDRVPVRVRVTALSVLTALVNDRAGRAGGRGLLGRQSNVLQALGVVKGTPHGVFPSLVRFCTAELGDILTLSTQTTSYGSSSLIPIASEASDQDMDMSLAVAFVQATTDLLSSQEAEVVGASPFRSCGSGSILEAKLYWMEAVLALLSAVVAVQSGAVVLTENGIVPALLHAITMPSLSAFHRAVTTQCVQALEITVSSHSAAAALYRDLNGVGILVDRLKMECFNTGNSEESRTHLSLKSETKAALVLAILASLSMSFHSQGVMSAGGTSRAIREGSTLSKVLFQLLTHVDIFGPVVFAQAAIVVSDIINNDPGSVNHVHAAGLAEAFLKTLTRWDIAELYPLRILMPLSSEFLTAVPTVLNALCLTTAHAERVAKYEPLMHLLDLFALPQYTEDEDKDFCFRGDTAAVVGTGVFELMRHVPSFQNAAIDAAVHAVRKVIQFGEESSSWTNPKYIGDKANSILVRMATHVSDLMEPLLSKSEYAAYFADRGGVRLLIALYQLILPSTSLFLTSALPNDKDATEALHENSLAHNSAVQSLTLALRSYAAQQPTNLLMTITKELGFQMDNLQRSRAQIGLPWLLSESGEGAEKVLSSLPDVDLTMLVSGNDMSCTSVSLADKVMNVGEYLRILATLQWLASMLGWTLKTAHTHMQSRRWFADFSATSTQQTMARLFCVDRSVQFERASLATLHQKKRKEKCIGKDANGEADANMELLESDNHQRVGLWKVGSLLLLRFSLTMRGLLSAYSKVLLTPTQHRRGDDIVVPLAPHARALARMTTQVLKGHLLYVLSGDRATQIDSFVQQYYLTFLLETISIVLFDGKKKQANTLLLVELLKPIADVTEVQVFDKTRPAPGDDAVSIKKIGLEEENDGKTVAFGPRTRIAASNLMDVVMNVIERFFTVFLQEEYDMTRDCGEIKSSHMVMTSFLISASLLQKLSDLEALSASPLTVALLTSDESSESKDALFEPKQLMIQLHTMCVSALLSIWKKPKFSCSSVESWLTNIVPIAVTILKNRIDRGDDTARDGAAGHRQNSGLTPTSLDRSHSIEPFNEALSFRRAIFTGAQSGRTPESGESSPPQPFVPDPEIVDNLISMGFSQTRVELALRQVQVNNVELAMEWILGHPENEREAEDDSFQRDKSMSEVSEPVEAASSFNNEATEGKKKEENLQAFYNLLRDSFEAVCFQILRVQAYKVKTEVTKAIKDSKISSLQPSQNSVKAIAEFLSYLCSRSDEDCKLVLDRLNCAILDYFHGNQEEGDKYLTVLAHLLALVLRLNPGSGSQLKLQSPSCIDNLVASVSNLESNELKPSCTPVLLVFDALVAGMAAEQVKASRSLSPEKSHVSDEASNWNKLESKSKGNGIANQAEDTAFELLILTTCLKIIKQRSLVDSTNDSKALIHAIWQLLSHLTLRYDLASYFFAHGGLDAVLDIPNDWFFVGYPEVTCTLLSQILESPEILEHKMEEKIRQAITKLSTRLGAPSQMRITPRALLAEVASFAVRNESVLLKALQNSVWVKKSESGRTYIVPRPKKTDSCETISGQSGDQPQPPSDQNDAARADKALHKLPKDHKHQAHIIVHKVIGRIRRLWDVEQHIMVDFDAQQIFNTSPAETCVGVYLQLLVHLITHFPACAAVLAKAKADADLRGERGSFVRFLLSECLPSRELCRFAAARKSLREDGYYGNSRLGGGDADLLIADVKSFVDSRTRMRVYNAHRLLVGVGSHSGEGSKCIISELVNLLQEWPQSITVDLASANDDPSVRDERALTLLHAWSGLIMSILWPKGSSKGFAWDKVLGKGFKGKHSFVNLLAEALCKIDLTHHLAHATCTMTLRPLSTLTRSFVTHRVRRLLKKRNHRPTASGDAVSSQNQSVSGRVLVAVTPSAVASNSTDTFFGQGGTMEEDLDIPGANDSAESRSCPLHDQDDDDVFMRSPLSAEGDHDMRAGIENEDHSEDEHSDSSSDSNHSTDEGDGDEDEEDEEVNDEDDDDDEDDEDEDDEDEDDDFEGEDEDGAHHRLHVIRRTGGPGPNRCISSSRTWGSLDSDLSSLDALDEVDEEEYSYLHILDDEALFTEEQRRRFRFATAQSAAPARNDESSRSSEDRLVDSMRDALGLYDASGGFGLHSTPDGQTLVLTFGDLENDERVDGEAQLDIASRRNRLGSGGGLGSFLGVQNRLDASRMANSLLQYIEELPDMLDDSLLFESDDNGGRSDRTRRERQPGGPGDHPEINGTMHPMLRMSGRSDPHYLNSLEFLHNSDQYSLPRHSTLLRELQDLTDQVQMQPPLAGSRSRSALGQEPLQRVGLGSRGRPPSRINRLSAVSNLLSEFSLDIPASILPERNQRLSLRRGDRDIFGNFFVGVDLSRGLTSRSGNIIGRAASSSAIWGPGAMGRSANARSVASRLEQQVTRICADDGDQAVISDSGQSHAEASIQDVDGVMEGGSGGTLRSGERTQTDGRASNIAEACDVRFNTISNRDSIDRFETGTDAASVLELTSTLGETSLLRSPPLSDADVDIADTESVSVSQGAVVELPSAVTSLPGSTIESMAPPAPVPFTLPGTSASLSTSDAMMNFTLDLSGFGALPALSDNTSHGVTIEEESKSEEIPLTDSQASIAETMPHGTPAALPEQQGEQQHYRCPEGMDAEVFASLPSDMQAEIIAQNTPAVVGSASVFSNAATSGGGGVGSESMSQIDLDMANSSFDRETLEALPPDIRAEVLENERREREAAARAETADTSRAQEMDNASFVASLAPELREEILVTCDEAFLQTLPSQVRAEATVLRERAAFRSTYRDRNRGTEERNDGGGDADMDELFNRPTLRRMLNSHSSERGRSLRRSRLFYNEIGGGRHGSHDIQRVDGYSQSRKGFLQIEKDEEEKPDERIFDDRCVRGVIRLIFMTQSVIQNRVLQRLLANICLYPLTRSCVRRNLLRIISLPLSQPLVPGQEKDDDDDGSGNIQFPPSRMYGCGIDGMRVITGSSIPAELVNRMLHVFVSLAKYNPRFTLEMLKPHGMRRKSDQEVEADKVQATLTDECGAAVLVDLLALPVVYRNGTNLDALLELLELLFSPLARLHQPDDDEEKAEGDEGDVVTPEYGDEWVSVPIVKLDEVRMSEIVSVLCMDLCTNQMQERTLAVLKLLNHVNANSELGIRAIVQHACKLSHVDLNKGRKMSADSAGYESSAVLPSAQDELKLLRLLHSLSDICKSTANFAECCQTIGLDPLWDALSLSLTKARASGGLDDQDNLANGSVTMRASSMSVPSLTDAGAATEDADGMVIEGKSAGASCAMAALLARFLPLVEAFFVVNARDAASMSLRVPDSNEREETIVAALRVGGFDGTGTGAFEENKDQNTFVKSTLKRTSSALSSLSEASEAIRLANFVESNRVLLNLLVREKPALLDSSLAALIKIPRCRAYLAFDNKRTYFHSSMKRLRQAALRNHGGGSSSVRIPVRRDHIFEDSYYALRMRSGTELRRKLHISFTGEEGIDAGGVTREWYMILAREMFNPNYVLFTSAADSPTFQPNPLSYVNKDHLSYFEFVGKVLGKAVADGQLLDAHFTRSFYKHILQLPITYHDMEAIDPEYYRNLHSILDNSIADLGLELTFSAEQSNFGKVEIVDLIPDGRHVSVTDENKMEYVKLVTHHRMATGIRQQIDAFLKGFHQLVPPELIAIFNENELELLISGMPEIDIDDLKANTEYANYKPTDSVIRWFWNVLYAFTHEERALFLQFVTGTSKVPLEGFKALEGMRGTQKFNIHKAFGNNSALPSAHTCFNQLDLPEYENEEKLKQCLLLAIREGSEGFGFG
ncbi:putative HECT domain, UBA-like superfamily, Ubiquitin-associated domain-containing protein [Plasmopara halstedii]